MRGHEALIAMRLRGVVPDDVHIDTVPNALWRDWHEWNAGHAHILVEPHELPDLLDLRCVVGMLVWVEGENLDRVAGVAAACLAAKAGRVIAVVIEDQAAGPDAVIVEELCTS